MDTLPERIRAFIALRMSSEVEQAIAALIEELRSPNDGIRWMARLNLHLTLKFLGPAVEAAKITALVPALGEVAGETAPFDLVARRVGAFPDLNRPRTIWVGLEGPELPALAQRLEQACARCDFEREQRPFKAHLTIARVNTHRRLGALRHALVRAGEREFGTSRIEAMTLYRSTLTPEGSIYDALAVFPFAARG